MTEDRRPAALAACGIALGVSMLGGSVLACSWFISFSEPTLVLAAVAFVGGIVALAFLAYRDARARGRGFWRSFGTALRDGGRLFVFLFP